MAPRIYLKPNKERPLLMHHHWVFSGAIQKKDPQIASGDLVEVYSADRKFLGTGYYNERTSIAVRMLRFEPGPIDGTFLWNRLYRAWTSRLKWFENQPTDAYRVVHAEGDFLPGLIVDRYGPGLVIQCQTLGMETLRQTVVEALTLIVKPSFVLERSEGASRQEEGLEPRTALLAGMLAPDGVVIRENGAQYGVDVQTGQKTGFFLDQRDNRQLVRELSAGKDVLNCFGYTGGFSVAAALGGAKSCVTVDISGPALARARENFERNCLTSGSWGFVQADCFEYLREEKEEFDMVILDPPAFAKHHGALAAASRGYKDINLQGLKRVRPGGLLLTCSCSHHLDAETFQKILFSAAVDAGREVQILRRLGQPADHPVNIFHPETEYLKAFLCKVH